MGYLIMSAGVYLAGMAFHLNGNNLRSDILLRVIPGLIGVGNIIAGAKMAGVI